MASGWVKCSLINGSPVFVNLDTAAYIRIVESETRIVFPGASDDYIRVSQTPDEIFALPAVERP